MSHVPEGFPPDELVVTHKVAVRRMVLNAYLTNGFVIRDIDTDALAIVDPGDRVDDLAELAGRHAADALRR